MGSPYPSVSPPKYGSLVNGQRIYGAITTMVKNTHLTTYMADYLAGPARGYAVLLSGPWGSGKTHLIRTKIVPNNSSTLYISVNGVADAQEVRQRLAYAAYPLLGDKTVQALGSIAKSVLGVFRFKTEIKIEDVVDLDQFDSIIVDDLERSILPITQLFGILNELVEYDQKKIIVIANEHELHKNENYKTIKEKLIGFTLAIEPDEESAILSLKTDISHDLFGFIKDNRQKIIDLFSATNSRNLRILKQAIQEFSPIYAELRNNPKLNDDHTLEFINLFLPLSMAYKSGAIERADIFERHISYAQFFNDAADTKRERSSMEVLQDKYPGIDLTSSLLSNNFLGRLICDGYFEQEQMRQSKQDVLGRNDPSASPEWRNLWNFVSVSPDVITKSLPVFRKKFFNRDYKDNGTILHAFGILLLYSKVGEIKWKNNRVIRECKKYIDDIAKAGHLALLGEDIKDSYGYGAAHGLGFAEGDTSEFSELYQYLGLVSSRERDKKLVKDLLATIGDLDKNSSEFGRIITQSDRRPNAYRIPIIKMIKPKGFVRAFLASRVETQLEILLAIRARYEHNPYPEIMEQECGWLADVGLQLEHSAKRLPALQRHRLSKVMEWNWPDTAQRP